MTIVVGFTMDAQLQTPQTPTYVTDWITTSPTPPTGGCSARRQRTSAKAPCERPSLPKWWYPVESASRNSISRFRLYVAKPLSTHGSSSVCLL